MNATLETEIIRKEIYHPSFNLDNKSNLEEIPEEKAIFGVFAIVDNQPLNCRFVGIADNLQEKVRELFDNPPSAGLQKFMQGAWIQMLIYKRLSPEEEVESQNILNAWDSKYSPKIDDDGEYPGYYH